MQEEQHRLHCATPDGNEPVQGGSYGVIESRLEFSREALVANTAPSSDFYSSVDGIKEERNRSLNEVNRYKMGKEQIQKIILVKGVAMKAMTTSLLVLEKRLASLEAEIELFLKTNAELALTRSRKGARGSRMEEVFIKTVPPMYL